VILDLFSRRVVGWAMSEHLERGIALDALTMALRNRRYGASRGSITFVWSLKILCCKP